MSILNRENQAVSVSCFPVGPIQANCYLVKADDRSQGVVIDPGGEGDLLAAQCDKMGMTPAAILLTHGHFDHVGGVDPLRRRWPDLPIYIHPGDVGDIPQFQWQPVGDVRELADGEDLALAGLTLRVLHTPGHSPGSVVFALGDALFTGDTLFAGSMGRTDFPGGDEGQMMASLQRLGQLEGNYTVYPGHMDPSTLDRERRENPFLRHALAR